MPSFTSRHISSVLSISPGNDYVRRVDAGLGVKVAAAAAGEAEAVARHESAGPVGWIGAKFLLRLLVVLQALRFVVVREQADEAALSMSTVRPVGSPRL